jgi:hypothetical protein
VINEANNQQMKISESTVKLIWKKRGGDLSKNDEKQMQVTFSQIRAINSIILANRKHTGSHIKRLLNLQISLKNFRKYIRRIGFEKVKTRYL